MTDEIPAPPPIPLATYRLQFGPHFRFADATALVPYLRALGVSHVYASPYLKARAGSTHGYDITDHNALNPEVGSPDDFDRMVSTLREHRMGQILDFVPNHMGIAQADNSLWLDVLEWGRHSPFAGFFDIDWEPATEDLVNKVLLPFLGDHYGMVLEAGRLEPRFDPDEGAFSVWYWDHRFPLHPRTYARVLGSPRDDAEWDREDDGGPLHRLQRLVEAFGRLRMAGLSARQAAEARSDGIALKHALAEAARDPHVRAYIEARIAELAGEPGRPASFTRLHRLLQAQRYRLAYWRVAADEINYRRFFDINELAGLRMERAELFDLAHGLVFALIGQGKLHGLRIDHIDGLYDPREYCERLQRRARDLHAETGVPQPAGDQPLYVVVEKILAHHEHVPADWPVAGTTGYEFANAVHGLCVDPAGEEAFTRLYARVARRRRGFDDVLYASKQFVMQSMLAAELQVLANEVHRIAERNWRTRDFTVNGLRLVLREVVAAMPVYRTYVTGHGCAAEDRRIIDWALSQARKRMPLEEGTVFDFVHEALTTDLGRERGSGYNRRDVVRWAMKFQQYTGPVMAKSLEDTSFYRYHRLVSLNEVGGDPRRFGVSVAAFHHAMQDQARYRPYGMLATATHDTKRGEDVRARLAVLSELPGEWGEHVRRWTRINRMKRREIDGARVPGANEAYLLYQTLAGAWPLELLGAEAPDGDTLGVLADRLSTFMEKALREAKVHSTWANPNGTYEEAVKAFVRDLLEVSHANAFLADFIPFQARIARYGALNGLAQTVLKLTVPGVPDIYRGTELWDLSLVDPDNRRPVDYAGRRVLLEELRGACGDRPAPPEYLGELLAAWPDGRIKLYFTWRMLQLRRAHPDLFLHGGYVPLEVVGPAADHVCAFARQHGETTVVVATPRLMVSLVSEGDVLPIPTAVWRDTAILLPEGLDSGCWTHVLTGATIAPQPAASGCAVPAGELFATAPAGVLLAA